MFTFAVRNDHFVSGNPKNLLRIIQLQSRVGEGQIFEDIMELGVHLSNKDRVPNSNNEIRGSLLTSLTFVFVYKFF